ncbi:MAG: Oligopeptide transport ATP-binding protein OppF [Chloroflexi bacterium ADurb.Bin325]|nr:MAG: Oligopeptide transport ATP-binding protein OppF [Chloroflexi bacterium ADurb.Bin325]
MGAILELQDVSKVFHVGSMLSRLRITAVDRASLQVGAGEIFGLAGESGSGKSTLARMILGFEEPTAGTIIHRRKDGQPLTGQQIWRQAGVQAVFQNPFETFNPLRQVESYFFAAVRYFGLAATRPDALARIERVLQMVGMSYEAIAGRYPAEFSGGQLQRVSIARSLLSEPSLLIADEPVSMVDASLRMSIMNLFRELVDRLGLGVVYITHDLATAYYVCDRIAIMFRGDIMTMGDVDKVLVDPRHPYVRLLRESIPEPNPQQRWRRKVQLAENETEEYLRTGCKFAGRCPQVMDICRRVPPPVVMDGDVQVKCHLFSGPTG